MTPVPVKGGTQVWPMPGTALAERTPVRLTVSIPTLFDRENLPARLMMMGCAGVSGEQIREAMVDACYKLFPPEEAEAKRVELDTFFAKDDEVARLIAASGGDTEKVKDALAHGPSRAENASYAVLNHDLTTRHPPLLRMLARSAEYDRRAIWLMTAVHVVGWEGIEGAPERVDGRLTDAAMETLHDALGEDLWTALKTHVDDLYRLGRDTEKNSGSPLESESGQSSSPRTETSGSSTASGSPKTRAGKSRKAPAA